MKHLINIIHEKFVSIRGHLCDAVGKGEKTYLNVDF